MANYMHLVYIGRYCLQVYNFNVPFSQSINQSNVEHIHVMTEVLL